MTGSGCDRRAGPTKQFFSHSVIAPDEIAVLTNSFYSTQPTSSWTTHTHPHQLALLFIILAMGTFLDLTHDSKDGTAGRHYYDSCCQALALADLLKHSTLASLQATVSLCV